MSEGWAFKFDAPVNGRFHRYFWSATVMDGGESLWWSHAEKRFVPVDYPLPQGGGTHSPPIRTFRAFRRFLRRHPELIGRQVTLVNRFRGFNITAIWQVTDA